MSDVFTLSRYSQANKAIFSFIEMKSFSFLMLLKINDLAC